ncbi:MAG: heme lyase CcmF/NrfE family subunit [Gammaproteobacteria bacterium]|nr:MAG: heme lyase CcmF/NrfE family subunit [Gammaproteobacteria bacterium]
MIPELGHFALILALFVAIIQAIMPIAGAARGHLAWIGMARPLARAQFGLLLLSFAALTWAFIQSDFSVAYVANNSNSALPWYYRVSAVWGAHEGSLVFWMLMMSGWGFAVTLFSRSLPEQFLARVIGVMGFISAGFLLFILLTSNPFDRLVPAALEGRDLNPLLQDVGLILHPPLLYMGYVGFSVAFSFAVAALLGGHLDAAWARWSRPWTTVAWLFLTLGNVLGSWWAYYELGWGGWWFWDPVENSSFMPWLVGTALIHSLAVTEKRAAFKSWTVLLAILTFSLSLLGTFLVRSGVLVSVHAFANDPARGVFILTFLGVVVGASLLIYAWRAPNIKGGGRFDLLSRETLLLLNNIILVVATATVLLGTLTPLLLDALKLGKISVGPPYYNFMFPLVMIPLVVLMGIGPLTRWGSASVGELAQRLRYTIIIAVIGGVAITWLLFGKASVMVIIGSVLALWVILTSLQSLWRRLRQRDGAIAALSAVPAAFYGMTLAHIGVGVLIIGVTYTSAFSSEKDLRMVPGQSHELGGYSFRFASIEKITGPNYTAQRAQVEVTNSSGEQVAILTPEKRIYRVQTSPMTEAAIDGGLFRDLYVALSEPLGGDAWAVRLYHKPFLRWIWLGALMMAFGGLLAASDRRYRIDVKQKRTHAEPINDPALAAQQ